MAQPEGGADMWLRAVVISALVLVTWFAVGTILSIGMRAAWPAYLAAEPAMQFETAMMIARLTIGAICTVIAVWIAADIVRSPGQAGFVSALVLLALFVPVHMQLWDKFPIWYHATFLVSLPVLSLLGARLARE